MSLPITGESADLPRFQASPRGSPDRHSMQGGLPPSTLLIWMSPNVGHGLPLRRQPDHVHRTRVSRCPARGSGFQASAMPANAGEHVLRMLVTGAPPNFFAIDIAM
jgi:hypothetical protein